MAAQPVRTQLLALARSFSGTDVLIYTPTAGHTGVIECMTSTTGLVSPGFEWYIRMNLTGPIFYSNVPLIGVSLSTIVQTLKVVVPDTFQVYLSTAGIGSFDFTMSGYELQLP